MEFLLIAAGGVFALLFIVNLFVQVVRRAPTIGFSHMLLAFLVALIPLAALMMNQLRSEPLVILNPIALAIAILLILLSLVGLLLELRRPEGLRGSRGVLGVGVGVLIAISTFIVPQIGAVTLSELRATPTSIVIAAQPEATESVEVNEPTPAFTHTSSPTPTITLTPTRVQPTPTPTATRFQLLTRTPVPTATLPNPCVALTLYNVNMRTQPNTEAELVTTIPYNISVVLYGRNDDSTWWFAEYEEASGWLNGEFLTLSASCAVLPERED